MTHDPQQHRDSVSGVIRTAKRLMLDARLLNDHERYASAWALAVLCLEEIGKMLLMLWGVPIPKKNKHIIKQRAVAALLMAQWVQKEFGHHEQLDEELIERGAKALSESDPGRFSEFVDMTWIDKSKQIALYHDDDLSALLAQNFSRGDAEKLLEMGHSAVTAVIHEPRNMDLGNHLFGVLTAMAKRRAEPSR